MQAAGLVACAHPLGRPHPAPLPPAPPGARATLRQALGLTFRHPAPPQVGRAAAVRRLLTCDSP
eukprot:4313454-Alexandrium_andersonii.AAC.1